MMHLLIPVFVGLVISCAQSVAQSTEDKEHISKEFTLSNGAGASMLAIYNINGFIKVEGTSSNKVVFDRQATDGQNRRYPGNWQKGLQVQLEQRGDTILAYIVEPFDSRPNRNNWRNNDDRRIEYDFTLDFTVKVPQDMNLVSQR